MMYYYLVYNSDGEITAFYAGEKKLNIGIEVSREEYDTALTAANIPHVMPEIPAEPEPTTDEILNALLGV